MSIELDKSLEALLADPTKAAALLKAIKKIAHENGVESGQKRNASGKLPYINSTTVICSLCGSETTVEVVMMYSPRLAGYIINHSILPNVERPSFPIHKVALVTESCDNCPSVLINYEKEELISLLMNRAKRDERYFNSLHSIANKITTAD